MTQDQTKDFICLLYLLAIFLVIWFTLSGFIVLPVLLLRSLIQ